MKKIWLIVPIVLFAAVAFALAGQEELTDQLAGYLRNDHLLIGYAAYAGVLIAAVVCMPLTVLPLIPFAASILGPFTTGVLSVIGWTVGSMIAFLISRHLGRPLLQKFISLEKLDELLRMVPEKSRFLFIVLLRLTLPVDLVSYALGLTKSLSFIEYSSATFIGVLWTSFSFAYLGDALLKGNFVVSFQLAIASLVIFLIGWYLLRHSKED